MQRTVIGNRAAGILYNYLVSCPGTGSQVIMPANICAVVPMAVCVAGLTPRFMDIDPATLALDARSTIHAASHKDTRAIVFVHPYGRFDRAAERLFLHCRRLQSDLGLIDDRCLLPPLEDQLFEACDLTLFSTGRAKHTDIGYGGIGVLTGEATRRFEFGSDATSCAASKQVEDAAKYAIQTKREVVIPDIGWLDTSPLPDRPEKYLREVEVAKRDAVSSRRRLNEIYSSRIPEHVQYDSSFQNWRFNITVANRDVLLNKIFSAGLFASSHYASASESFGGTPKPNADKVFQTIINLFNDRHFLPGMAIDTAKIVRAHIQADC